MRNLLLSLMLLVVWWPSPVVAHDIGVSQAELVEQDGGHYVLSVQSSPTVAYLFATPLLPAHCEFVGNPRGTRGSSWKIFDFTCADGLTAADAIKLPWRRDAVMLTAKWQDGSEVKRLFLNEAGIIPVPLSELRAGSGSFLNAAKRYTDLGIEHI